ncbi:Asp23/Gls24 family envelope stress response protein [Streptomyces sp. NBC_00669]|uniref:Asp23/Gls24 family envelope stress response protein n=1 Tax=Streptomyces sp. NBC_00669 TaxID=2976011 RepID=UPI002E346276|nr:Asp23/Gls24 family envelope stress response protein [Streptomyces sp. NBC_00669]
MTTAESTAKTAPGRKKDTAGKTTIANTVVATIAGIATREVEGVYAMGGGAARAVGAVRDRVSRSDDHTRGVKVEVGEEQAALDIDVVVDYGTHIAETASDIRGSVTSAVELMTGLEVVEININVRDVHVPGEDSDTDEDEGRVR